MKRFQCAAVAVMACALSACAIGPNYRRPATETPDQFKESAPASADAAVVPEKWWTVFGDPKLDELEERVAVSNQTLAAAEAAYRQASAVVREARASFFPFIGVSAEASRAGGPGRSKTVTTGGSGTGIADSRSSNTYQAGASASWEIDLWGRLRRSLENAHALADASAADLAAAKLSLQAQLATAYLQLREADSEVRLYAATVDAYTRALQIAQNRYNVGSAAKVDVLQARTQLANAQEQSASVVLTRAQLEHAIAALVGEPASRFSLETESTVNTLVPGVPAGVPSALLAHRPDIQSAERRVAAANANIGVQEAAYLPSLTLNGTYEFLSTAASTLFKTANEVHTVSASAAQTLFDAGATRARVSGARASYDQSVAEYRQSVLAAFQDVEDQLVASRQLESQHEFRRQASEAADESERLVLNQYRAGTVSFTNVVVAQTAALSARVALSQIAVRRQTTAIALIQATGGGWQPQS
jgi:NodT family efflux transporter outer membrane factor (OMF) lipoprotein